MNADLRRRVEEVFATAYELPPGERTRVVEQACASEPELIGHVRAMLRDHDRVVNVFLDPEEIKRLTAMGGADSEIEGELAPGTRVGEYIIESRLGAGGMGVVYVARQEQPSRQVALKVIRGAIGTRGLVRRFEHEAEVLARLQHPGIAQVFSAGTAEIEGVRRPYIAMELVRGEDLVTHCRRLELSHHERAALVAQICDAVEHAHQRGVIHRDLKPQNILVDEHGRPKVLDFGVARVTSPDHSQTTLRTGVGQLIGTLAYMSPEQIAGDPGEVDTRSDVYALGVVLFQLLAGKLPHDVTSRSLPEAARIIREDPPTRLSRLNRVLRGELDTIVTKAIEKDKARRYQTASALGEDLRRYLAGEPILASPDTMYVLGKQLARYRWVLAASLLAAIGLAAFGVYASWQARTQRVLATAEQLARVDAVSARDLADRRAAALERALYFSRIGHAHAAIGAGDLIRSRELLEACRPEDRGWEWRHILHLTDESRVVGRFKGEAKHVAVSMDQSALYYSDEYGVVRRCDPRTGEEQLRLISDHKFMAIAPSPDGQLIACAAYRGEIHLFDANSGREVAEMRRPTGEYQISGVCWSPDGARLAASDQSGVVWVFERGQGVPFTSLLEVGGMVLDMAFLRDSSTLVVAMRDGRVRIIDVTTGDTIRETRTADTPVLLAMDQSAESIFIGGFDSSIFVWAWRDQDEPRMIGKGGSTILVMLPVHGDRELIVSGRYPILECWDVATGQKRWMQRGEPSEFRDLYAAPGTDAVRTIGTSGRIREWSLRPLGLLPTIATPARIVFCAEALQGRNGVILGGRTGVVYHVNTDTGVVETLRGHLVGGVRSLGVLADGAVVASGDEGAIRIWPVSGESRSIGGFGVGVSRLAVSPDKARIALVDGQSVLTIIRGADMTPHLSIPTLLPVVADAVWSGDGTIAVAAGAGEVGLWFKDGAIQGPRLALPGRIAAIEISPDSAMLLVGLEDGSLHRYELPGADPIGEPIKTGSRIARFCFHPDGSRLFTAHSDRTIRVWDSATGEGVTVLAGHGNSVVSVFWLADGTLASVDSSGFIRQWPTVPLDPSGPSDPAAGL